MPPSLAGKTAIVSGVGPGLGIEIVRRLAHEQANLVLGDLDSENLLRASGEATRLGASAVELRTDIRDALDCENLARLAMEEFGCVDILVNDAFLAEEPSTFESTSLGDWQAVADVNLWGTLRMIKAALPSLKSSGEGCILNVNSHGAELLDREYGGYTASKAALAHVTQHLAREFGPYRIRVNGVHPGPMDSALRQQHLVTRADATGTHHEAIYAKQIGRTTLGFLATTEDVSHAVLFLVSPAARAITGQALYVDAGAWFH